VHRRQDNRERDATTRTGHLVDDRGRRFETASLRLSRCRYTVQLSERADDITRDYFQLWQVIARRGGAEWPLGERDAERMDFFATQLGRLEGIADALVLAGRNVRLFPLPPMPWLTVERTAPSYS
jgi:hypothetical protein